MQAIARPDSRAPLSVGYVYLSGWTGDLDHDLLDLLHRVTDVPCAMLRDSIERLPAGERYHLDTLAHEILYDARMCSAFV